jgi:ribonuclease VapC
MTSVLDASALLALLNREKGADTVAAALTRGAAMSAVNWAEVLTRWAALGAPLDDHVLHSLVAGAGGPLRIVPFDDLQARETARIRLATTGSPLSLGDRACLALGRQLDLPVLTSDRTWKALKLKVKLVVLR